MKTIKATKQRSSVAFSTLKCTLKLYQNKGAVMVEARGIEPLSESPFLQLSTSVVYLLKFPIRTADKQAVRAGSPNTFQ